MKKDVFIAVDLHDMRQSKVIGNKKELAELVGVNRNTLTNGCEGIYGHYFVVRYVYRNYTRRNK